LVIVASYDDDKDIAFDDNDANIVGNYKHLHAHAITPIYLIYSNVPYIGDMLDTNRVFSGRRREAFVCWLPLCAAIHTVQISHRSMTGEVSWKVRLID